MLKFIGTILLIAAGSLCGLLESRKLILRERRLEDFLSFLQVMTTEIRFSQTHLDEIIRRHGEKFEFLKACAEKVEQGAAFLSVWREEASRAAGFNAEDRRLLQDFGVGLGTTDISGQLAHCELYTDLFQVRLKEARGQKEKKAKLYLLLGIFGGIAAALLLG